MSIPFCSSYPHLIMTHFMHFQYLYVHVCAYKHIYIYMHIYKVHFKILIYFICMKTHVSYIQAMLSLLQTNISVLSCVQAFANNAN